MDECKLRKCLQLTYQAEAVLCQDGRGRRVRHN